LLGNNFARNGTDRVKISIPELYQSLVFPPTLVDEEAKDLKQFSIYGFNIRKGPKTTHTTHARCSEPPASLAAFMTFLVMILL
jgi:hypothetical protein